MPIRKKGDIDIRTSANGAKVKQTSYTFYSYDKKSAALYFQFREQDGQPTDLGKATVHLVMILNDDDEKEFIPKSDEIEVISAIRGTAKYVLPEMLLSYSGKVTGYVYMDFDDGSQSDDGQFTFRIKHSMITHVLPEAGDKYVQDFEDVKERVEQAGDSATKDIEKAKDNAESQIGDYVGEVESAKDNAVEDIDKALLVDEAKNYTDDKVEGFNETITTQLAQKANDVEVRKKAVPITENDVSSTLLGAISGTGTVNVTSVPRRESVTMDSVTFKNKSTNLVDPDKISQGYYVVSYNGAIKESSSFQLLERIPVQQETQYIIERKRHIAFYDIDGSFISGDAEGGSDVVVTTPPETHTMSVSWENTESQQINEGSVKLPYEPFYEYIQGKNIEPIKDGSITYKKTDFITSGKNLFNKDTATAGYYVKDNNGVLGSNTAYHASDFIDVSSVSSVISNKFMRTLAFYTGDKFISGESNVYSGTPVTVPEQATNVRVSAPTRGVDTFQLETGREVTPFEPYGYKIPQLLKDSDSDVVADELLTHLPKDLYIASGRTIELYNNQVIWTGNLDNFHIQWQSSIGKSFKRKWSFTASDETIGDYSLTLNVYDNNMNQVATDTTTVHVVDSVLINTHNVVTIGDSLSNNKPWLNELEVLADNKLVNIGTRQGRHEGRSGATAHWYLGDNTYTFDSNYDNSYASTDGSENPFWNPATSEFDFDYYKTTYNKDPQAVQLFLGTNGITVDPTENASNIKSIVDGIRASDATIPIFVVNTLYRGSQNGIGKQASNDGYSAARGQWKLEEDRKVFNLMVRLDELLNDYSNVHFVPVSLTHDSEYNFGQEETPVNPRSSVTEPQHKEATHPQTEGYLQMADIMFSTMAGTLS